VLVRVRPGAPVQLGRFIGVIEHIRDSCSVQICPDGTMRGIQPLIRLGTRCQLAAFDLPPTRYVLELLRLTQSALNIGGRCRRARYLWNQASQPAMLATGPSAGRGGRRGYCFDYDTKCRIKFIFDLSHHTSRDRHSPAAGKIKLFRLLQRQAWPSELTRRE